MGDSLSHLDDLLLLCEYQIDLTCSREFKFLAFFENILQRL